jgi:hypothetical protein
MFNGAVILRPSEFFDNEVNHHVVQGLPITEGETYNVLVRRHRPQRRARSHLQQGLGIDQPEPVGWAIQYTMLDQEPFGSFYLNAHYVDVTFGDITFTPLPDDDLLLS